MIDRKDDLGRDLSRSDRDFFSYTTDSENKVVKRIAGAVSIDSPFGKSDTILATYPTASTEVYTYQYNAVNIGTITVTYTNSSKSTLASVVSVEL